MSPRPQVLHSHTTRMVMPGHEPLFVTLTYDNEGQVFEVITHMSSAGGCENALVQALSIAISIGVRSGVPPALYIEKLRNIKCLHVVAGYPTSLPDMVGKVMEDWESKLSSR